MPPLRRQCLARFGRYLMAGFEVTINGRFWVTAEVILFNFLLEKVCRYLSLPAAITSACSACDYCRYIGGSNSRYKRTICY
jgi:hypothetical protein